MGLGSGAQQSGAPGVGADPSGGHGQGSGPSSEAVECSACGHVAPPIGKGQCEACKAWVDGNVGNLRHGLRRYQDTGVLPDDLRKYRTERYAELVGALGGEDDLSPQRQLLAGHVVNLEVAAALQLDFGLRQGAETKRGRQSLADYRSTVDSLRRVLGDLGLDRRERPVPSLDEYLKQRQRAADSGDMAGDSCKGDGDEEASMRRSCGQQDPACRSSASARRNRRPREQQRREKERGST